MEIYKIVTNNIKYYMNLLAEDDEYKIKYPNTNIEEYVSNNTKIKYSRLIDILNGREEITIEEVYRISIVLGVSIENLFIVGGGANEEKE